MSLPSLINHLSTFIGEPRDGIALLNLQSVYLVSVVGIDEATAGLLFLCFGMAQILLQVPLGIYINNNFTAPSQALLLSFMAVSVTALSLLTVTFSNSLPLLSVIKFMQGGLLCILPPALNALSLKAVASLAPQAPEFSAVVADNEMGSHAGTFVLNLLGGVLAFLLFPYSNVWAIFVIPAVSTCLFVIPLSLKIKKGFEKLESSSASSACPPPRYLSFGDGGEKGDHHTLPTVDSQKSFANSIKGVQADETFRKFAVHLVLCENALPASEQDRSEREGSEKEGWLDDDDMLKLVFYLYHAIRVLA